MKNGRNYKTATQQETLDSPKIGECIEISALPSTPRPLLAYKAVFQTNTQRVYGYWFGCSMDQPLPNMATIYLEYSCPLSKPRLHMILLYILILFQQGLTPSDLQNMDGERIWAVPTKRAQVGQVFSPEWVFFSRPGWLHNTKWREWILHRFARMQSQE